MSQEIQANRSGQTQDDSYIGVTCSQEHMGNLVLDGPCGYPVNIPASWG